MRWPPTKRWMARSSKGSCKRMLAPPSRRRSEEHTSELQSPCNLVCRLLLEKKKYSHKESILGAPGGYLTCAHGSTGDWSDFSTELLQMTESMLVTAQLAYAYTKLAELADLRA